MQCECKIPVCEGAGRYADRETGAPENSHYVDGHGCPTISFMRIAVQHRKPIVVYRARTNAVAEAAELPVGMIPL